MTKETMTKERMTLEALKIVADYYDTCIFRTTEEHDGCPFSVGFECALEQYNLIEEAERNIEQTEKKKEGE